MFLIFITAFLDILGMSIFLPFLPSVIAAFGVDPSWSAYTQALYAIGMFGGGLFFGSYSDTHGRKKTLIITSSIYLVSYILMLYGLWGIDITSMNWLSVSEFSGSVVPDGSLISGMSLGFLIFLVSRILSGVGGSGFSVIQAYISDISTPETRAKNMGMMGAAFGLAFLVGPALSAILSHWVSLHVIVVLGAIVIGANVLSIRFLLPEPKKHFHGELSHRDQSFTLSRGVMILFVLSFGATLGFTAIQSLSGQFYMDRFGFDATHIGYTMAMVGATAIIYQGLIIGYVRRFWTEKNLLPLSLIILMISFVGFSLNQSPFWLFGWLILFPIGMGTFQPSIGSLLAHVAGKEVGKVMGYNSSVQSVGQIIGPIVAGVLYTPGSGLPFLVSAGVFGILFLVALMDIG